MLCEQMAQNIANNPISHVLEGTEGRVRVEMSTVVVKENETLDIQQEIRKREHYEKPSVRRKKKSEAARKRKYN